MAEIALETHGVCNQSASKSATRHFLDAVFDFTGGVAGNLQIICVMEICTVVFKCYLII